MSGEEESVFPDSTVQKLMPNGNRTIEFPNGQKEVHTKEFKVKAPQPMRLLECVQLNYMCCLPAPLHCSNVSIQMEQ